MMLSSTINTPWPTRETSGLSGWVSGGAFVSEFDICSVWLGIKLFELEFEAAGASLRPFREKENVLPWSSLEATPM